MNILLYVLSALGCGFASGVVMFVVARFIGGIGIINMIFTFLGLWLIDRIGRRTLLYIGSFGYILSLGLTAWGFFTQHYAMIPACLFAFIAAHAVGQGTVIWVLISEIFPNRHRAEGQALGSFTHWLFAALLTTFSPRWSRNSRRAMCSFSSAA